MITHLIKQKGILKFSILLIKIPMQNPINPQYLYNAIDIDKYIINTVTLITNCHFIEQNFNTNGDITLVTIVTIAIHVVIGTYLID